MALLPDAVAKYIGDHVSGLSYSETLSTGNVYVDVMPDRPDNAVAVYASTGGEEADSKLPYDPSDLQVMVRGDRGGTWARDTWQAIYSLLHGKRNQTINGVYVVFILATHSSPFPMGPDENDRVQFTMDLRAEVLNPTSERA